MEETSERRRRTRARIAAGLVVVLGLAAGAVQLVGDGADIGTMVLGASSKKGDTTPPAVSITFPVKNSVYGPGTWTGCVPAGVCGTASDVTGVSSVRVAVLQQATARYWDGSSFASSNQSWNTAVGSTAWSLPLSLPPDGDYLVSVQATDPDGNTSKPVSVSFQVDGTAVNNKIFGISGSLSGSFVPGVRQTLDLVLTNPYSFPIKVTGVTVRVEPVTTKTSGGTNPDCVGTDNLKVLSQAPFTSMNAVTVPAGPGGTYAVTGDQRPVLEMPNLATSQDACKNTTFTLSYTGTAEKQ